MKANEFSDLFDKDLPFHIGIHRVSYKTDTTNYMKDPDLEKVDKGLSTRDPSHLDESQKGFELKKDIKEVAESVDRGYSELNRATKIKVFKQLLKEYGNPIENMIV